MLSTQNNLEGRKRDAKRAYVRRGTRRRYVHRQERRSAVTRDVKRRRALHGKRLVHEERDRGSEKRKPAWTGENDLFLLSTITAMKSSNSVLTGRKGIRFHRRIPTSE